jgi:hypothetical protein
VRPADVFEKGLLGGGAPLSFPVLNTGGSWMKIDTVDISPASGLSISLLEPAGIPIAPGQVCDWPVHDSAPSSTEHGTTDGMMARVRPRRDSSCSSQ